VENPTNTSAKLGLLAGSLRTHDIEVREGDDELLIWSWERPEVQLPVTVKPRPDDEGREWIWCDSRPIAQADQTYEAVTGIKSELHGPATPSTTTRDHELQPDPDARPRDRASRPTTQRGGPVSGPRLYVWDAKDRKRGAGGVTTGQDAAQRALVSALKDMAPGARGKLRTAALNVALSSKTYDYGKTLMTGVRTRHGVRIREKSI
jgi:hypothetical protein